MCGETFSKGGGRSSRVFYENLSLPEGGNQALNYQIMQAAVFIKFPVKFTLLRGTICGRSTLCADKF